MCNRIDIRRQEEHDVKRNATWSAIGGGYYTEVHKNVDSSSHQEPSVHTLRSELEVPISHHNITTNNTEKSTISNEILRSTKWIIKIPFQKGLYRTAPAVSTGQDVGLFQVKGWDMRSRRKLRFHDSGKEQYLPEEGDGCSLGRRAVRPENRPRDST